MKLRRTSICIALGTAACSGSFAQDIRVNVTGTNIKRIDTETAAPIETITREDIQASGLQTISDVVRQITANNNGTISPSFTFGFSASGSAVSLRGLGSNNTLVLLNGRRLANFGLADDNHISYVDLQQIPFDAVERIEILKDGASAIYGSDAVAGVVNVILRQQYTGVTVTATAGTTYNSEGNQAKGALTAGVGDLTKDGYNVFVTFDGQIQKAIPASSGRAYAGTNDLRFMGFPDQRFGNPYVAPPTSFLGNIETTPRVFSGLPGPCAPQDQDGTFCRWDPKSYVDLQPEVKRYNLFGRGTYAVSPDITAYAELSYFNVNTNTSMIPPATSGTWWNPVTGGLTNARVFLPPGHPDNPAGVPARLLYRDAGLGNNIEYDTGTQRFLAGVKGTTAGWDWDAAALYIRSDTDISWTHAFSLDRLVAGIAGTGPYGYYRIGASAAQNDPAVYDWIAPSRNYSTRSQNTIVDAKGARDLLKLDGGQLALAVGYEFRREELSNPGLPGTETGNVVGLSYTATSGSRNVNAVYAELFAPLLRNLEVTAAVRYDHYSDFGSTTNPKVGVKWTALPQLVLRGTWQTAFRAPGLYEIGSSTIGGTAGGVTDPVRCPITGSLVDCGGTQMGQIFRGTPYLQPEKSQTYTLGVIWEPVPGLSGTLDYWNIVTKQQITTPDLQPVLENPAAYPLATVLRDDNDLPGIPNSGTLLSAAIPYQNGDNLKTDGIDLDVVSKQSLGEWGNLRTELQWTHIFRYTNTLNGQSFEFAGTQGPYGLSSGAGTPMDRANLIIGWQRGPWNVTGTVRYVSGYDSTFFRGFWDEGAQSGCIYPGIDGPDCHVASFTTLDLSASYSGFKNWQIFGSVINVFNRNAPFNIAAVYGTVNYNYNWAYSGATGTQFNLGFRYTFE